MAERRKSLKLGLIGCGRVTETLHLPALKSLPEAEVVALADIDPVRLRWLANRFGIKQCYPDHRSLLDDRQIEAVAVCVPPQFHGEVGLAALGAGKHLFIEKPLALSLDEGERLVKRAIESSARVMVGFNMRWHRLVRQARDIIVRGDLGQVRSIRTVCTSGARYREAPSSWRGRRELGGGVLFELGVHHFDLWRFLLQSEAVEVFATSRSEQWEDETATVTARLSNGVLAASLFSLSAGDANEVEVYGQGGRLRVSCHRFDGLEFLPTSSFAGDIHVRFQGAVRLLRELPQVALNMRHGGDFLASYRAEWRHFIDSIHRGTPVESSLDDGLRALQVALAAVEAASLGCPVSVAQGPRTPTPAVSALPRSREQGWGNSMEDTGSVKGHAATEPGIGDPS
jgi:predicted dehydrogenase